MAHSGIEPETYIKQSPYALPTELFRPMRVTGFNLYLYIMTAFSSLRGVCHTYYYFRFNIKILALMKNWEKYVFTSTYTRPIQIIHNKL